MSGAALSAGGTEVKSAHPHVKGTHVLVREKNNTEKCYKLKTILQIMISSMKQSISGQRGKRAQEGVGMARA